MKLFGAIAITAVMCFSATAGTIYDNTGFASEGRDPAVGSLIGATPFGPLYNSFTTGANASNLTSLSLVLQNCDTVAEPQDCSVAGHSSADIGIFADLGGNPDALISTLATVTDDSLITTPTIDALTLGSNPLLAANTRYWIGITGNDADTTLSWNWDNTDSGLGVLGEFESNTPNGTFGNSDFPGTYQMLVGTTDVVTDATPEPLSSLLLGSGAVALGLLRRRTKKK